MTRAERTARAPLAEPLSFEVELPSLPPHLNHAFVTRGNGRPGLSRDAEKWRDDAVMIIQAAMNEAGWAANKRQTLHIDHWFYDPLVLKWDMDGLLKVLWDALKVALGVDDAYFVSTPLNKRRGETRVVLTVTKVMFDGF